VPESELELGELALVAVRAPVPAALWGNPRRSAGSTILSCRRTRALATCSRMVLWVEALALELAQQEATLLLAQS